MGRQAWWRKNRVPTASLRQSSLLLKWKKLSRRLLLRKNPCVSRLFFLFGMLGVLWVSGGNAAESAESSAKFSYAGVWTTADEQQQLFDLMLFPNGQAVSNWTKGTAGVRGERGFWREIEGRAVVVFQDGWTDVIQSVDGGFEHAGYAPGTSLADPPTNRAKTWLLEGPQATLIGVWRLNREPDGSFLYMALQSNGRAASSINGLTEGRWEISGKGLKCTWPEGWTDLFERSPAGAWEKSTWVGEKPEDPAMIDISPAVRVGEAPFVVAP